MRAPSAAPAFARALAKRVRWQQAMVAADRVHVIDESRAGNMGAIVVVAGAGADDTHLRIGEDGLRATPWKRSVPRR